MNKRRQERTLEILLVEDNPDDAELTVEALKGSRIRHRLTHLPDGEEAMAYLRKEGRYAEGVRPHLILLDLNLPKKDGREVLSEIKSDGGLKDIPVIVLTTSQNGRDIQESYGRQANSYITKPANLNEILEVAQTIEDWLTTVKLP